MKALSSTIGLILRHPATMSVKRHVRDLRWSARGRNIANPAVPDRIRSILFVCLGNICRSPFAALIAARRLSDRGVAVKCTSAGITARQAERSPADARSVAEDFGVSLSHHVPQLLTRELIDTHDAVVVMEASQFEELAAAYPHARERLLLLPLFDADDTAAYERYNIADPFAQPRSAYEACYQRIDRAVSRLLTAMNLI
jgi:protein-tyrosine phosphatase